MNNRTCPDPSVHGNPFRYCPHCDWMEESLLSGANLIALERQRQISQEGWTPEHDDEHDTFELTRAAIAYATEAMSPSRLQIPMPWWPWSPDWWKPSDDPVRNLARAGALIAAEIDRLQRLT